MPNLEYDQFFWKTSKENKWSQTMGGFVSHFIVSETNITSMIISETTLDSHNTGQNSANKTRK